ncbi:MAG: M48 family metalloprotease [Rickettsiales bacterium]|nr:M48 family metalloprotease [Rickettsiales bacterium]
MFSKPLSLVLVYIVTVINIVALSSPFLAAIVPFVHIENNFLVIENEIFQKIKFSFLLLCFIVSFLTLVYLVFDFLFGFSVRTSLKGCTRYEKIKDYDFLTDLFKQVKAKFGENNVKLYIKNSDEINAYAVSSLGSRAIVLTSGLINHYLNECHDPKKFLYALRSIIGHEMSHLVNKDFLPTFLIITNQKITNSVSSLLFLIFSLAIRAVSMLPFGGRASAQMMRDTYSVINFAVTFFNRFVVYNVYEFLRRTLSRSVEFRCDRQSAKAFGGKNMALALSMLGESGYFTIFSTHPKTKSRMERVENIKISDAIVKPQFLDSLSNYFSLMFLVVICLYFAKQARVDYFVRLYLQDHEILNRKITTLWQLISRFF